MAEYINLNKCKSFKQTLAVATAPGTPLQDQRCSEVIIKNNSGGDVIVYDQGAGGAENGFLLSNLDSATFRGVTNTNQVSAAGAGDIYYRSQYYSINPSR